MNKFVSLVMIGAFSFVAVPAFAQETNARSGASTSSNSTAISCVKSAVTVRESALKSGFMTFSSALESAYTTRASALDAAYLKTSRTEVRTAVRSAWDTFKSSVKTARDEWRKTRDSAWKTYKSSVRSCRGSSDIQDTSNTSAEAGV